jgi:hypothetical protein
MFDLACGLRNDDGHGADLETQRMIRLATCERAIRRLYHAGESLLHHENIPFVTRWRHYSPNLSALSMTEEFLLAAMRRVKVQTTKGQRPIKEFFGWRRTL